MNSEKDVDEYMNVATPPLPGNRVVVPKSSGGRVDPKQSPHFKAGDNPVWISCRVGPECEGKYAVLVNEGEIGFVAGGGNWARYKCLTCGGAFHITR